MSPQRIFNGEFSSTGLRERVSACRRRVRESRTIAAAARISVSEQSLEAAQPNDAASAEAGNGMPLRIEGQGIT